MRELGGHVASAWLRLGKNDRCEGGEQERWFHVGSCTDAMYFSIAWQTLDSPIAKQATPEECGSS